MPWHLGVDPGKAGAAVALAPDGYAEVLWSWRTSDRGLILVRVAQVTRDGIATRTVRCRSPHALGMLVLAGIAAVAGSEPVRVACEAVHVGKSIGTSLGQELWNGQVLGPLIDALVDGGGEVERPRPARWRKAVGINPRLKSAEAKAMAVEVLPGLVGGLKDLVDALGRRSVLAHDYEAGGIAACLAGSKSSSEPSPST